MSARDLAFVFTTADGKKRKCKFSGVSSHADLEAKLREKLSDADLKIDNCEVFSAEDDEWVEEIPYDQTRGYVKRVLRSYHAYRVLY